MLEILESGLRAADPYYATLAMLHLEDDILTVGKELYTPPGTPLRFSQMERQPVRRAPVLGEHTEEVLSEVLGLGGRDVGRLVDRGVVAGAS